LITWDHVLLRAEGSNQALMNVLRRSRRVTIYDS
jgi:hypothetical protein